MAPIVGPLVSPDLRLRGCRITDKQMPRGSIRKYRHWKTAMGSRTSKGESPGGPGIWGEKSCRIGILCVTDLGPLQGMGRGGAEERSCPNCVVPSPSLPVTSPAPWERARSGSGPSCQGGRGEGHRLMACSELGQSPSLPPLAAGEPRE